MSQVQLSKRSEARKPTPRQLVTAYADFVQDRIDEGWKPTMITLMFNQLNGPKYAVAQQMSKEVERVYGWLLTRRCRRPGNTPSDRMPFMLACPDYPVPKESKDRLVDIVINDGLHYHAIDLMPPWTRSRCSLSDLIDQHQSTLTGPWRPVTRLHAQTIVGTPERAVAYVLKSLTRGRATSDELLVLPRAKSEARVHRP